MSKTIIYTSAAVNYMPKVRKLFHSLRKHHPEFELVLALADARPPGITLGGPEFDRIIALDEIEIPDRRRWTFFHDIVELATAIKPFVLMQLLSEPDVDRVLYFDPDMVVFDRLDDLLRALDGADIVLTPHQTSPELTLEAIRDNEISSLKHGVYNLGFLGVRPTAEGKRFAAWWAERIYHFCVADIPNGLFTDQRWVDLAPAFFDGVHVLKSPRFNVAPWNISRRRVTGSLSSGVEVEGQPLGFYHFTGFDSGAHRVMARKNAPGNPAVEALVDWYQDETKLDHTDPLSSVAWKYGTYDDGSKIPRVHRRLYRARPDLQEAFADPFETGAGGGLKSWMTHQGPVEHPEWFEKKKD